MTAANTYDHQLFAAGVYSVLHVDWTVRCATPLAVRNGEALAYSEDARYKTRGRKLALRWQASADAEHEVAALYYGYRIEDGAVNPFHFVPPSSVRGALRGWTVRRLVDSQFIQDLTPPDRNNEVETARYIDTVKRALSQRSHGYELIASLFGLATDTRAGGVAQSNAARLHIATTPFDQVHARAVDAAGASMSADSGPENAHRQMTVRNPLDRLTQASKDHGLHHFLEFARGQTFTVRLTVHNVRTADLALIGLWRREIDAGLLRVGALTAIGRGRLSVAAQSVTFWQRPDAPPLPDVTLTPVADDPLAHRDVLAGIWQRYDLPDSAFTRYDDFLHDYAGGAQDA